MESFFEFLFKYRPLLFREGDFTFGASWPVATALAVFAVVAGVALYTYVQPRAKAGRRDRVVMGSIRLAILGVLLFCLFRPILVNTSVVPQRNFVGVLIDDSRSMALADEDGEVRSDWVARALGPEGGDLLADLQERFTVRLFRFSSNASRIETVDELGYDGTRTDLATALDQVREELSSVPLSGLVVISDGADNGGRPLAEAMVPLQAASIPVYPVGLGEEVLSPDVQVGRIEAPRRVLKGSTLLIDVVLSHRGYAGETVPLIVEDAERILAEEQVELGRDGEPTVTQVRFTLEDAGPRRLRFRVPPRENERVQRNNERDLLLDVRPDVEKVLYFEGEPRWEVKFTLRAVEKDENIQLVLLQRTTEDGKMVRRNVDDGDELAGGFPLSRAELFQYQGLVIGSVEASFLTKDQLDMIAEFASQRGGGVLFLGGRRAFSEGGFIGTPIEEALPIVLGPPESNPQNGFTQMKISPTVSGRSHPATQIRTAEAAADSVWRMLPELSTLNRITEAKPGATVLLTGEDAVTGEERVVMAHHRYGRGKVMALAAQDVWTWQMHGDVPLEDMTHETLWTQILRWVVDGVPDYVDVRTDLEHAEIGESVRVIAEVADSAYLEINDAVVTATVRAPDGSEQELEMDWTVERDGEYAASFTPDQPGEYQIVTTAISHDEELDLGAAATWVRVGPSDDEYFDANQRRALLERAADETGGRYYTASTAASLPEDIQYTGSGVTLVEERDLWDMPFLFMLLVALLGAEWAYRRTRGLI